MIDYHKSIANNKPSPAIAKMIAKAGDIAKAIAKTIAIAKAVAKA